MTEAWRVSNDRVKGHSPALDLTTEQAFVQLPSESQCETCRAGQSSRTLSSSTVQAWRRLWPERSGKTRREIKKSILDSGVEYGVYRVLCLNICCTAGSKNIIVPFHRSLYIWQ